MLCPLSQKECITEKCSWWTSTTYHLGGGKQFKSEQCAVSKIASELGNLAGR